jgi:hypothetical protein
LVLDIREAMLSVTAAELRDLATLGGNSRRSRDPRGPVAIVADTPSVFGISRMYETLAELNAAPPLSVFKTMEAAEEWLAAFATGPSG